MTKISGDSFGSDFSHLQEALNVSASQKETPPASSGTSLNPIANAADEIRSLSDSEATQLILALNPAAMPAAGQESPDSLPSAPSEFRRQLDDGRLRAQLAESALDAEAGKPAPGSESSLNPQPLPPRELLSRLASILQDLQPGGEVMLNPQPLPPREAFLELARRFGDEVSLNPQPLPPREAIFAFAERLGDEVALNPQPLPPRETILEIAGRLGDEVSLNPRPLPPREAVLEFARRLGEAVSLNPQPLPPRDPGDPA